MTPLQAHQDFYLKREDSNPTGSIKDRSLSPQIDHLIAANFHSAVISSTGNAAISAQYYCAINRLPLTVFVSPKIHPAKLKLINHPQISSRPVSAAFKFAKLHRSYNLRQSTDPNALNGYSAIADELLDQLPKITSIFLPVGSGSTLVGITNKLPSSVKIFAVQPSSHCPIASHYDNSFTKENITITDALSAKLLPLKRHIFAAIDRSGGFGIVVQNADVIKRHRFLLDNHINLSAETALAIAGYDKIRQTHNVGKFPVIIATGCLR